MTSADNPENTVPTSSVTSIMTDNDASAHPATIESATDPLFLQSRNTCQSLNVDPVPGENGSSSLIVGVINVEDWAEIRRLHRAEGMPAGDRPQAGEWAGPRCAGRWSRKGRRDISGR
jgi:hypothetical protein